jgi:hypothetical protein
VPIPLEPAIVWQGILSRDIGDLKIASEMWHRNYKHDGQRAERRLNSQRRSKFHR